MEIRTGEVFLFRIDEKIETEPFAVESVPYQSAEGEVDRNRRE